MKFHFYTHSHDHLFVSKVVILANSYFVRSPMPAAEGGLLMWVLPLYLHVNQKSHDDDDGDGDGD